MELLFATSKTQKLTWYTQFNRGLLKRQLLSFTTIFHCCLNLDVSTISQQEIFFKFTVYFISAFEVMCASLESYTSPTIYARIFTRWVEQEILYIGNTCMAKEIFLTVNSWIFATNWATIRRNHDFEKLPM